MKKRIINILLVSLIIPLMMQGSLNAQGFRSFEIGSLWDTFWASSAHTWQRSWNTPYHSFMVWPANRNWSKPWGEGTAAIRFMGPINASASSYWIGASPWKDANGKTYNEFVSEIGWWYMDENRISLPRYIKKYYRHIPPEIVIDGVVISDDFPAAPNDELKPDLVSDQMIENAVRTNIGVDILQRAYAYTNRDFDNIIIIETIFTNTGNTDLDSEIEIPNQVLNDVYFDYSIRPTITREGHTAIGSREWHAHEFAEYDSTLKVFYAWDGDAPPNYASGEDVGDPDPQTGYWLSTAFLGIMHLHADMSPSDESSNPNAPYAAKWIGYTASPSTGKLTNNIDKMYEFLKKPTRPPSWVNSGDAPPWHGGINSGNPNWHNENQVSLHLTYGPYQMQQGENWRFVFAKFVNGLSQKECERLGKAYKEAVDSGNPDNFVWTNPTTGETFRGLAAKANAIATSRDSLFKTAERAKIIYENNFNIPDPPMSPSLYVTSAGGGIMIEWSDDPEHEPDPDTGVLDFEGYRLYRSIGEYDSTEAWELIYEGTDHEYFDTGVPPGVAVYYYCTAYDDGTQNWLEPGKKLESGRFWNMTTVPAYRLQAAEENPDMDNIDVVPNPYNINDPNNFPSEPNKLLFVNLPGYCTITIYTMTGEKVKTIEHMNGTSSDSWDQVTEQNQYIASGIYLYHVQKRDMSGAKVPGEKIGKIVIIR
ncbi:MAG: T9SS type A sorting domain-containing protein [Caldisericaceae bacterium]|nr:T9SS type A sorting domain-containing protein [Caldisericaceae bacterium]